MNRKLTTIKVEKSSGNVFADLGLANSEDYLLKAKLASKINAIIKSRRLKQKEAADLLKIDQPKISALAHGRLDGFSIERLFKFLTIFNQDIDIVIKPQKVCRTRICSKSHINVLHADI